MGGSTWIYLGTFEFGKDKEGWVSLTNRTPKGYRSEAGTVVTADAVRFGGGVGNIARQRKSEEENAKRSEEVEAKKKAEEAKKAKEAENFDVIVDINGRVQRAEKSDSVAEGSSEEAAPESVNEEEKEN